MSTHRIMEAMQKIEAITLPIGNVCYLPSSESQCRELGDAFVIERKTWFRKHSKMRGKRMLICAQNEAVKCARS